MSFLSVQTVMNGPMLINLNHIVAIGHEPLHKRAYISMVDGSNFELEESYESFSGRMGILTNILTTKEGT